MRIVRRAFTRAVVTSALLFVAALGSLAAQQRPLLWRDPGNIAAKDLFGGPGGRAGAPRAPFTFVDEDISGTKPKLRVRDAAGRTWNVKFRVDDQQGDEVQSEVAATRIAWALGYFAEATYFVPAGRIQQLPKLERKSPHLSGAGEFTGARFERRSSLITKSDTFWSFASNPFLATREFSGLKILMALVSNWDNHDSNNRIVSVSAARGPGEQWYAITDWGSTFGRFDHAGFFSRRTRWNVSDYESQKLVDHVTGDAVVLAYKGTERTIESVPLSHAKWFAGLARRLTDAQLRQAFAAAGATADEARRFAAKVKARIGELP